VAEEHLAAALEVQPNNASLLNTYGGLKQRRGQAREAIELFRRSLALRRDPKVHFALANALIATRQVEEAVVHFDEALKLSPGWPPAANNLAWILATHTDRTVRDGEKAVVLARRACQVTNHAVPDFLSTLAAALAEAGRFEEAVEVIESGISIAQQNDNTALVAKAQAQLELYRNHQPLRSE
jgi:Flp pilus assembly protein TadD